jgi:hypothetical protein
MLMRKLATVLAGVLLVGGLAACGGGDDEASDDTKDTEKSSTTEGGSDDGGDTTLPNLDFADEDCQALYQAAVGLAGAFSAGGATGEEATFDFGALADALDGFADDAPDDIAGALKTMADGYAEADDALGGEPVDFTDPSVFMKPEFQQASEVLSSTEFSDASTAVSTYFEEQCADFSPVG